MKNGSTTINTKIISALRVYAMLLVYFCHCYITARDGSGYQLHGLGRLFNTPAWGGVWMFFTIGGFLAAYGFERGKYELTLRGVLDYYKGRIIKILFPTWIFLSIVFILFMRETHITFANILKFLTCTYNGKNVNSGLPIGATWYVFVTMWLYLFTPPIMGIFNYLESITRNRIRLYLEILAITLSIGIIYRYVGGGFYI